MLSNLRRDFRWQRTKAGFNFGSRRAEEFESALNERVDTLRAFIRIVGAGEVEHDVGVRRSANMWNRMDDHPIRLALMLFRPTLLEEVAIGRIKGKRFPKLFGNEFGSGK
jgi:hypothetical protein